jgi:hypothetical protein
MKRAMSIRNLSLLLVAASSLYLAAVCAAPVANSSETMGIGIHIVPEPRPIDVLETARGLNEPSLGLRRNPAWSPESRFMCSTALHALEIALGTPVRRLDCKREIYLFAVNLGGAECRVSLDSMSGNYYIEC